MSEEEDSAIRVTSEESKAQWVCGKGPSDSYGGVL